MREPGGESGNPLEYFEDGGTMAVYYCSKCKELIKRDARLKPRRGRKRLRSFCSKTGKDSIIVRR